MSFLLQEFQCLWQRRVNQEIDSSLILYCQLLKKLGLDPKASLIETFKNSNFEKKHIMEDNKAISSQELIALLSFESSLARAQRKNDQSLECIKYIEDNFDIGERLQSFYYQFEKAISLYVNSDWLEALSYFIRAEKLSFNQIQSVSCYLNIILCHENLDLAFDNRLMDLEIKLSQMSEESLSGVNFQLESLKLRKKWRNLDLSKNDFKIINAENVNQKTYFLMYQKSLPYNLSLNDKTLINNELEHFVNKPGHLFNKKYRLNTLLGYWNEADNICARWSDQIERLYLWCWRWIENPSLESYNLFMKAMHNFQWEKIEEIKKLPVDDQSTLVLVLGWLSYYSNQFSDIYTDFQKSMKFSDNNKQLNLEAVTINQILNHIEVANKSTIYEISKIKSTSSRNILSSKMIIDFKNNKVLFKDREVKSKSICRAMHLLKLKASVSIEDFYSYTISQSEYDEFLNSQQVSNLIFKLNQILDSKLIINRKQGYIYISGNLNFIEIINYDQRVDQLQNDPLLSKFINRIKSNLNISKKTQKKQVKNWLQEIASNTDHFSRLSLQAQFGLSKSESLRLIEEWLKRNWVLKKGFGKNTIYLINSLDRRIA